MIAVILVNYNGATDTIECIKSLVNTKNNELNIIVVDNCSSDNSIEELEKVRDRYQFTLLIADENRGFSAGNNIGIRYALEQNADIVILLNNDTVVEPDFIDDLILPLYECNGCGATTSKINYYNQKNINWDAGGSLSKTTAKTVHYNFNQKDQDMDQKNRDVSFASGCCICISRQALEKVGYLNENFFLYEEDAEYCFRILKAGYKIVYVPTSVIYHKVSSSTGQGSPMSQYYSVRNKYYFITLYYKGLNRIISYLHCTAQFLNRCRKKELSFKYYKKGLRAFINKEVGKSEESIV